MTYREHAARCVCNATLDETAPGQHVCRTCGIVHVTPEAMVTLVRAAAPDIRLRTGGVIAFPRGGDSAQLFCPDCGDAMTAGVLFEVGVDQCVAHGLWFDDAAALARVLENARVRYERRND